MKKRIIMLMLVLAMASVGAVGCSQGQAQTENSVSVAVVDGQGITQTDFDNYVNFQKKGAENSGQIAPEMWTEDAGKGKTFEEELKTATLDYLVTQDIIIQAAEKQKLSVTDEEVNAEIDKIKKSLGEEDQFKAYLEKMGTTEDYMKTLIKDRLVINKYLETNVKVEDEAVEKYYQDNKDYFNKVRASHILVKVEKDEDGNMIEESKTKAFEKIKDLQKQLTDGKAFDQLAIEASEGPSAPTGGDLGYFGKGQMVKEFEESAFSLETGKISEPVLSQFGYHLIKVTDQKMDFASNREDVKKVFTEKSYSEKVQALTDAAKVEKLLSFDAKKEEVSKEEVKTEEPKAESEETKVDTEKTEKAE